MKRLLPLGLLAMASLGFSATYHVKADMKTSVATVNLRLEEGNSRMFRMCAWAPGDYEIFDYGKQIASIEFKAKGKSVRATTGSDPNLWILDEPADEVVYTIKPSRANFGPNLRIRENELFLSGPGVLGWFDGHTREKQRLLIDKPTSGSKIYGSLPEDPNAPTEAVGAIAKDYDELIDAPIVVGDKVKTKEFTVAGKPHFIVAYGTNEEADMDGYAKVGAAVATQAKELFGELPYPKYCFMLDLNGQGGGLEHRNSARIGIPARVPPAGLGGIMFHEYFHCFNVKRIRARPLGPFDYTKPAVTGALWWLEGVTDYYADVLLVRSGLSSRDNFVANLVGNIQGVSRGKYLQISADEASRKVWQSRGSFGFDGVNYYSKGSVAGAVLDLAIRAHSQGKRSLDDVIRQLWKECRNDQPGFAEGRIRELCIQMGGPALGEIYDQSVMRGGYLPMDSALEGLNLKFADQGFSGGSDPIFDRWPLAIK